MCDNKLNIPFLAQEKQIYPLDSDSFSNYKLDKLDISYNDPTNLQLQKFKNTSLLELKTNGKTIVDISGDICDTGDQLTMKGTLRLQNVISGPYRTEGGIIQFQRLFLYFDQLVIPIQMKYSYDANKICNTSNLEVDMIPSINVELDVSQSSILFDDFFVSNGIDKKNRNEIFTGLIDQFKDPNGSFRAIYENFISELKDSEIFMLVEKELNRMICQSKTGNKNDVQNISRTIQFLNEDEYYLSSNRYNEKISRLKDKGYLDLIFK
jgi:hypothetical protein